ncbi:hypothetical protein SAMN02745146_3177 [Hymenobacter daecheongensis DSM 21074]|uniref:Uncharacterized protein n=1 Tax=Hymenobacter daecheongensis DSM 21074 TaxID=1121955 RepID=A0A1M6JL19_9BACT|nr:hypothetical protein [Hymenobacter daecheongensis]SHJ47324.1 hypothetical protein SAMN02745146_3177 [Hymenobacter daecheongensis DSM 21074]
MRRAADTQFLVNEALALLSRLQTVRSFALSTPMVLAAAVSAPAQAAINSHLAHIAFGLRRKLKAFISWLRSPESQATDAEKAQARYVLLKLRFNSLLDQFDIFADVLSQRGEHGTGTWLAGLDVLAEDALHLPGGYYEPPPLICFLERGHGAAIRRARTRLPGGDDNPVGVIQIPRERMVGSGIASSLIHEVGHQGSELLDLTTTIRAEIDKKVAAGGPAKVAWQLLSRWLNEILSDFWALGHLGIGATYGLMSVVSLPSYFVFRIGTDGPHPFPWIRVRLSIALGEALFPHRQWADLTRQWSALYPTDGLPSGKQQLIGQLVALLPEFAQLVVRHRSPSLRGQPLAGLFPVAQRQPARLRALYRQWQARPALREDCAPSLVFAVIGQAKADGRITAGEEARVLTGLLTRWALNRARNYCGLAPPAGAPPPAGASSPHPLISRSHEPQFSN